VSERNGIDNTFSIKILVQQPLKRTQLHTDEYNLLVMIIDDDVMDLFTTKKSTP